MNNDDSSHALALAALLTAEDGSNEQADMEASYREMPNLEDTLANLVIDAAIPRRIRDQLSRGKPICLSITVPGLAWCAPLAGAMSRKWSLAFLIGRDGSNRSEHVPTKGGDDVSRALRNGQPVVGVSHVPARYQPSTLISAADAHLSVKRPSGKQVRKLLKLCVAGPTPRNIPDDAAAGLDYEEIRSAFRGGASATEVLANLARATESKSRVSIGDATPPMEELSGYGEVKVWGLKLAEDLAAWRQGKLPWNRLSAAAVFHGPPGTGKTLGAKALAKTLGVPIVVTSVGDWFASTAGNLDSVIKGMQSAWDQARALQPAMLFIDELDGLPDRRTLSDRGSDWWTPVVNYALTLFDGAATSREGLILIGATNHPKRLDPALIRPGRFDRLIEIPAPTAEGLAGIIRHHLGSDLPEADLASIARMRPGATGALAAKWVRDARSLASQEKRALRLEDLIVQVAPRETRPLETVRRIARHEAAHAVVGVALGEQELVSVTLSAPDAEGAAHFSQLAHRMPTRSHFEALVLTCLAGRAIDEADDQPDAGSGGGSGSDLANATRILATLHLSCGLGDTLVALCEPHEAVDQLRLDRALRATVEAELQRLYRRAQELVALHERDITLVANTLVARRFLTGAEVRNLIGPSAGRDGDDVRGQGTPR